VEESNRTVRILRVMSRDEPGYLGKLAQLIGNAGANIGDIVRVRTGSGFNVRDFELYLTGLDQLERIQQELARLDGFEVEAVLDPVMEIHRGGKIRMRSTVRLDRLSDVRQIYTPGVAEVCLAIHEDPAKAYDYTSLPHTVAIITNGTAILGLGNIGVHAGLPVMEGKAVLLDRLVGLSGVPILIPTRDIRTFVDTVIQIAPSFGAIQLEDVAAPECFEIERRLAKQLPIPVMHDDQHGTAVVVLAALLNATKLTGKQLETLPVGLVGLGAAGLGIARLLSGYGVRDLIGTDINQEARGRLEALGGRTGELGDVMAQASVVIATTGRPGLIQPSTVRKGQIFLALSNPNPEISPSAALAAGAAFAVDGRSVNNALGFPGIFRGALAARARRIDSPMKIAAAQTIAQFAEPGELIPSLLHPDVHQAVAAAVEAVARKQDTMTESSASPWETTA